MIPNRIVANPRGYEDGEESESDSFIDHCIGWFNPQKMPANFDPTRMWLVKICGAPLPINRMDVINTTESDRVVPHYLYQKLRDLFFGRKVAPWGQY
jgi:hypothetical protein